MLHRNGNGKMPPEPPQYNNRRRRLSTIIENADRNTAAAGRINYSKISVVSELRAMVYGNNNEKAKNADAYGGNDGEELQQPAYSITGAKNRKNNDGHWMDVEYGRPPAQTHLDRFHRNLPAPNRKPTTRVVHEARAVRPMNLSAPLALMHTDKRNAKMLEIFRESLASRIRTERSLVREFLAEFLGTFVLLLIGVSANVQAAASPGGNVISAQFAWGFGLAFGVYLAINVSGAHLNPAISFSTLVTGDLSLTRFFLYVLAQLLGAFVGTAVAFFGHYDDIQKLDNGTRQVFGTRGTAGLLTTFPAEHMTRMGAFLDQIIGTAILAAVVALLADRKHRISTSTVPLLAGLTLTAIAMTYGANAGFAVNPARDFAPRLFALCVGYGTAVFSAANYYFWMPIIGQLIGALAGTLAYKLFVGIHGLSERVEITGGAPYPRDDRGYKEYSSNASVGGENLIAYNNFPR